MKIENRVKFIIDLINALWISKRISNYPNLARV